MRIVAVSDRRQSLRPFLEQMEVIASSGVDMVVLREKDLPPEEYRSLAEKVRNICARHGCVFCINTFSDIAEELGVDTVWIPFAQLVENGRPSIAKVGVSVHSEEEAYRASELGADFVIYGNVFETTCKPGKEARGFDELRMIAVNSDIPVYAIGGINRSNLQAVHDCHVDGACVMSGFMKAEDPSEIVSKTRNLLE